MAFGLIPRGLAPHPVIRIAASSTADISARSEGSVHESHRFSVRVRHRAQ